MRADPLIGRTVFFRLICKKAAEANGGLMAGIVGQCDKDQAKIDDWIKFESTTLKVMNN